MKRRDILGATVCSLGTISGCTSLGNSNGSPVQLTEITLSNARKEPLSVAVTVERDRETIYDEDVTVDAGSGDVATEETITGPWMEEAGRYEVTTTLNGTTVRRSSNTEYQSREGIDTDEQCFSIVVLMSKTTKIEQLWQVTKDC